MNKEIWKKPKICSDAGGSALIEGVMMRNKNRMAISVRKSTGEIYTEVKDTVPWTKKRKIYGFPFIRGAVSMLESMVSGVKVLMDSAELVDFEDENEKESKFDLWLQKVLGENYITYLLYSSVVIALVFGIGLFMLLPNVIAGFAVSFLRLNTASGTGAFLANLVEGLIRITIFLLYMILVSQNKEIKRVFQYHGAEHKTIHAYENAEELTVENVRKHTTIHPRCGTTFMFLVIMISIVIFAFTGWHNKFVNLIVRLALLPLVSGVSYEVLKFAARTDNKLIRAMSIPGLMLQKITTKEPDDSMIEVAIASLKAVVEEKSADSASETAEGTPVDEKTAVTEMTEALENASTDEKKEAEIDEADTEAVKEKAGKKETDAVFGSSL
ncbi:MAG: DUF1385 domain-containing protein [Clostridiaceae bacterium]|nr:DUF1385 domain-containing protein [Clostridiaceae bacterium]